MAKGDEASFAFRAFRDRDTGTLVTRLTPQGTHCLRNYFYQKGFTADGKRLLVGSDLGTRMNFWLLDVVTGRARQLTEGARENVQGAYLSADDRWLYFTRGNRDHVRVDLETLEETIVYTVPEGWVGYGTWSPNSATTRTVGLLMKAEDRVTTGEGWARFAAQYHARPLQRLFEIDLATGKDRTVYEEKRHLGHPMYRPGDDTQMGFCHEGPHDLVDSRIWLIRSDGTGLHRVKEHAPGESVMHEFWVPDGSQLLYVSYTKGEDRRWIGSYDPGTDENRLVMPMPPCAHLMSNDEGSLLVGDGAGQLGDVADQEGHAFTPDPLVYLFDLKTKTHRPLCGHHSSWKVYGGNTQASHPHPSFTPDGRRVLFASDFEGDLALYMAEAE